MKQRSFFQAQSSSSFSFAEQTELALIPINPATHPFPPPLPANIICKVEQWVAYWSGLATAHFVFGTSVGRSSQSAFGRLTGNDVSGHYKLI